MSAHASWSLFGLTVRSQLPLPFAATRGGDGNEPDVSVRFGTLSASTGRMETCRPDTLQFEAPGAGHFRISAGREIVIDPAPGASERNLRLYLLGSAFGALLHQRGVLPLHANAIVVDGQAIAFMGPSGSGKSTLAVWFQDRGHVTLADDVCAVTVERDKFDVPAPSPDTAVAAPLAALYVLEGEAEASIEPLRASQAVEALIAHTYRGSCIPLTGASVRHFVACLELARRVPVHLVKRRKDATAFERTAWALESHARAVQAGAAVPVCP